MGDAGSTEGHHDGSRRLVRALALATFLQWIGAGAILPLLPVYLRQHGGSDTVVGAVMSAFFAAGLVLQYPAGRLADRVGRRVVLVGGLAIYAVASAGFLSDPAPSVDIALRALQGAGAGASTVAALAMVATAVPVQRRGRAFGAIYGCQLGGLAIGPLVGSLVGVRSMGVLFVAAGSAAVAACLPVLLGASPPAGPAPAVAPAGSLPPEAQSADTWALVRLGRREAGRQVLTDRAALGAVLVAAALGLTSGVYEACWTLLLHHRGASDWEIGLSWTLFALPFAAMSGPGGWLADHLDRRWLGAGALAWSVGFCALYPFLGDVTLLLTLGCVEAVGFAVAMPSAQSLLTEQAPAGEHGRAQGLFSTAQTGATALAAACGGALFGVAVWLPFVAGAVGALLLLAAVAIAWAPVPGRVLPAAE
ncbi:MAG: MFS transporter [Acidimicrobiales bacterium]